MDLRAVFFDAGETLLYPHPSFAEVFTEVLRAEGHSLDPAVVNRVVSAYSQRFTDSLLTGEGRLWSTSPERSRKMWRFVYDHFLTEVGVPTNEHDRIFERLYARFTDLSTYRLHPDAVPVLERLRKADLTLGLISNFEAWLERLLEALEVGHYFDVTVISGVEGVEKPDPRIFRIALERAGVEAEHSVYVGDHPVFDVQAASEAGMVAVLVDRRGRHADADAIRITSLEDLPAAVGLNA
ncbi:MAG: HAD family hydrolase [Actinomycetota bacterium]